MAHKPVELPVYGKADHNLGIYHAIGVLVINWATTESIFLAMLQALLGGDKKTALVVWFSHFNTATRIDVVSRMAREHLNDASLIIDIDSAAKKFGGASKVRNYYCHSAYRTGEENKLVRTYGGKISDEGKPIRIDARPLDTANLNIIVNTANQLWEMQEPLWNLVLRIEDTLQVPPSKQQTSILRNRIRKDGPVDRDKDQERA